MKMCVIRQQSQHNCTSTQQLPDAFLSVAFVHSSASSILCLVPTIQIRILHELPLSLYDYSIFSGCLRWNILVMHSIKRSKKLEISLQVREDKVTDLSMLTSAFLMTLRKYNSIFFCLINGSRPCTRIRNQSHKSHHKICITTYCALVRIRNFVHLKIQERSQTSQIRPSAVRI